MNTQRKLIAAMSLCATIAVPNIASAIGVSGQGTWETTLQGRDLDGDMSTFEAYYDTALNITWLANANHTTMNWSTANAWADSLALGGYTDWRLPITTDTGTSGCNFAYSGTDCGSNVDTATSEMAHLFYTTLGNTAYYNTLGVGPQAGWGLSNTGPFSNVPSNDYWSATEYAPNTSAAWRFYFYFGSQDFDDKTDSLNAWAVHTGDVGASVVPVPTAAWLFGSGLIGLITLARKKRV